MATVTTQWVVELAGDIVSPIEEITETANGAAEAVDDIGKAANGAKDKIAQLSATDLKSTADSIRDLTEQFEKLMRPGMDFEVQMKEVQAITQMTDEEMGKMGRSARDLAEQFGGSAGAQLESFGAIIAQFGPEVAQNNEAMQSMGNSVATLSKLMKNDAVGAMDALTTSMLQFGVDVSNPIEAAREMERMMHVMAAAGNEGASEVGDTGEALKVAGLASKNARLSFEETNAALQSLAQGGRKGSEAGVSLRNVLGKMAGMDIIPRRAQEKLKALGINYDIVSDKTIPFVERLRELKKAQGDATLLAQIFGIENEAAANILLDSIDAQEELTERITGTNAANESAAIIMSSNVEQMGRMDAWLENLKISFYNVAGSITPYVVGLGTIAFTIAQIAAAVTGISQLTTFIKSLTIATKLQAAAQWLVNIAMSANPIVFIIAGIAALVALIAVAINYYDEWGAAMLFLLGPLGLLINTVMALKNNWDSIVEAFQSEGVIGGIKRIGVVLLDAVLYPVQQLLEILSKIPGIGEYAATGADKIANLRAGFDMANPEKTNPDSDASINPISDILAKSVTNDGKPNKIVVGSKKAKGDKDGVTLGGKGGGGGKTINMTVNNYITATTTKEIAEAVAKAINGRVSDTLAIL